MYAVRLPLDADESAFRAAARQCISHRLSPADVTFIDPAEPALFPPPPARQSAAPFTVPRGYYELLQDAVCHKAADRLPLLYDVLWRLVNGDRGLMSNAADPAIARLTNYVHSVRRDIHKMHAFLRFRPREIEGRTIYTAWFEPQHFVLKRAVPFFVDRFTNMDWHILTPIGSAEWRDGDLAFGPPAPRPTDTSDEVLDDLWSTYYRTTFNPARVRLKAMLNHMPKHYWNSMAETALIPSMIEGAEARLARMAAALPDTAPVFAEKIAARDRIVTTDGPAVPLERLQHDIMSCQRCALHEAATQAVTGEGPQDARIVFVGEQPGDQEDLVGRPFVGPAGQLFDRALAEAGLDRKNLYVTNAVKHFKFEPRGKRRIHKTPGTREISVCRWWLDQELEMVRPKLVVALGATAANALARRSVSVMRDRGPMAFGSLDGFVTIHPSFLLRLPDEQRKAEEYAAFVNDLRQVRDLAATSP